MAADRVRQANPDGILASDVPGAQPVQAHPGDVRSQPPTEVLDPVGS
jgi:hypothetical protein